MLRSLVRCRSVPSGLHPADRQRRLFPSSTPSAFNMQGARCVLVIGKESDALWATVNAEYAKTLGGDGALQRHVSRGSALKASSRPQKRQSRCTTKRSRSTRRATAPSSSSRTTRPCRAWQPRSPRGSRCLRWGLSRLMQKRPRSLATVLPTWATTSSGMLQFAVWTALEAEGLGASLQVRQASSRSETRAECAFSPPRSSTMGNTAPRSRRRSRRLAWQSRPGA